jgi:hypothetical protein
MGTEGTTRGVSTKRVTQAEQAEIVFSDCMAPRAGPSKLFGASTDK